LFPVWHKRAGTPQHPKTPPGHRLIILLYTGQECLKADYAQAALTKCPLKHKITHTQEVRYMRATLNIPEELMNDVQLLTGAKSRTGAIIAVMEEYVKKKRLEKLLALQGQLSIDYDWQKAEAEEIRVAEERNRYGQS